MRIIALALFLLPFLLTDTHAQCISGNCSNGTGIYLYPSGAKYIGQFEDGEIHGIGACYYTDGSKYQGEWSHRYPEGKGTMIFADGTKWTGSWRRGHPIGEDGNIIENLFPEKDLEIDDTNIQSGCIVGDCDNGQGIFAYADGSKYEGEFRGGLPGGMGTFSYSDGEKYVGEFQNGLYNGQGTFYHENGRISSGEWREGEFFGSPVINDGETGCIAGDCKNGRGTYIYRDGAAKYVGEFEMDMPNGKGAVYYANGDRYVGYWEEGTFNGEGTLYLRDGTEIWGLWENGNYLGEPELTEPQLAVEEEADFEEGMAAEITEIEKELIEDNPEDSLAISMKPPPEDSTFLPTPSDSVGQEAAGFVNREISSDSLKTTAGDNELLTDDNEILADDETLAEALAVRNQANLKVWAVIVGVSHYNHMPTLRYTDDDAYQMFAFLKSPEGGALTDEQIRILIDEDATKENIVNTVREVFGKAGPNDLVMMYFSGHGLKGSFLPIDYDGYNNKLLHKELNALLDESPAKYKLCIADACHSGSLLALKSGEIKNALASYYERLAQSEPGTALIMSSKSDETSLESSGFRQGVFSHFLIRGLKGEADFNSDKVVTIQELFNFIYDNVRKYTGNRQSPLIQGDYDKDMTVAVIR